MAALNGRPTSVAYIQFLAILRDARPVKNSDSLFLTAIWFVVHGVSSGRVLSGHLIILPVNLCLIIEWLAEETEQGGYRCGSR